MALKGVKRTTIGELSPDRLILPIGGSDTLRFREWTTAEDLLIGELSEKSDTKHPYHKLAITLSVLCEQFGPHVFWEGDTRKMAHDEAIGSILNAPFCNVFYSILILRIREFGTTYKQMVPVDGKSIEVTCDLSTMNVDIPDDQSAGGDWRLELENPITIKGGKAITAFDMHQPRYNEILGAPSDTTMQRYHIVAASIRGCPDLHNAPFSSSSFGALRIPRAAFTKIWKAVEPQLLGPTLQIMAEVNGKKHPVMARMDFDHFFA